MNRLFTGRLVFTLVSLGLLGAILGPTPARAQVVTNPTTVVFTASSDQNTVLSTGQAAIDHYELQVFVVGATQPFEILNIGKPTPDASNTITYDFSASVSSWPLPGGNYDARVAAVGPGGAGVSGASNDFTFASACSFSLSSTSLSMGAAGGTGQVTVATASGCSWTATSNVSWITVNAAGATGGGSASFTVAANTSTSSRSGTLTVAGQTYTVTQAGACNYILSTSGQNFSASGGTGSVSVTSSSGCAWTASSPVSWVTVAPMTGTGNGTVNYTVAQNTTTSSRSATLTIGGVGYSITEQGMTVITSGNLPSPWQSRDVGAVGVSGSASYSNGTFTVSGAGADIWGTADAFQYVEQPLNGDGQIVARVSSEQNTNSQAKAGVMLRQDLTAGGADVILDVMPGGGIEFMTRSTNGGSTAYLVGTTQAIPAWLRLQRSGATVTGSVSADGVTWRVVGSTSITMTSSAYAGLAVTSHTTTQTNTATFDNVAVGASPSAPTTSLPQPWNNQDIGTVGLPGTASYSNSTFTVSGAGSDIWGTADSFEFVYQPLSGDGQVIARVTGLQNTNSYAKAGVMLRETLAAGSDDVILDVTPSGAVEFMSRGATNGSTTYLAGATQAPPAWLKLVRSGSVVTGSVSSDGVSWRVVGSTSVTMASGGYMGLAVTSHTTSQTNTATFDNVAVSAGLPAPWRNQDIGSVGISGAAYAANGQFTVKGAGSDIWGTADSFQYVYQPWAGDGQIVARVTALQNTNTYAKAGVMLRETLDAGSRDVILDLTPGGAIEFMTRSSANGATTYLAGATRTAPVWLRLVRTGSSIVASVSADGVTWSIVGSVTTSASTSAYFGLAVTSHTTSQATTATFDNVGVR